MLSQNNLAAVANSSKKGQDTSSKSSVARPPAPGAAPSIAGGERAAWQRASSRAIDLLRRLGPLSCVHDKVYKSGREVDTDIFEIMLQVVCAKLNPPAVDSYCKEIDSYLDWLIGIGQDPVEVGPVTICGYIRSSKGIVCAYEGSS